jgi:hypothetical protein
MIMGVACHVMRKDSLDCRICAAGKQSGNTEHRTEAAEDGHVEDVDVGHFEGISEEEEGWRGVVES